MGHPVLAESLTHLGHPDAAIEELVAGFRVPGAVIDFAARLLPHIAPALTPPHSVRRHRGDLVITRVRDAEGALVDAAARVAEPRGHDRADRRRRRRGPVRAAAEERRPWRYDLLGEDAADLRRPGGPGAGHAGQGPRVRPRGAARAGRHRAGEPDEVTGLRRLYVCLTRAVTSLVIVHSRSAAARALTVGSAQMQAVVQTRTGGPEVLEPGADPEPVLGEGDVKIAVRFAGPCRHRSPAPGLFDPPAPKPRLVLGCEVTVARSPRSVRPHALSALGGAPRRDGVRHPSVADLEIVVVPEKVASCRCRIGLSFEQGAAFGQVLVHRDRRDCRCLNRNGMTAGPGRVLLTPSAARWRTLAATHLSRSAGAVRSSGSPAGPGVGEARRRIRHQGCSPRS